MSNELTLLELRRELRYAVNVKSGAINNPIDVL
jgi:hypothetical protein